MSRAGDKAFNRCDVKIVEFSSFIYRNEDHTKIGYYNKKKDNTEGANPVHAGNNATLHCPRTEDDRVSITSKFESGMDKVEAMHSLRQLAGELVCRNCRYSSMTPVQVSEERAHLTLAEAERTEALAALERARDELRQISPPTLT